MTSLNDFMKELFEEAKIEGTKAVEEIKMLQDFFRNELKMIGIIKETKPERSSLPGAITSPQLAVAQAQFDKEELKSITQYVDQNPVDPSPKESEQTEFSRLVAKSLEAYSVHHMASKVGVSIPTYNRWASGDAIPHNAVMGTIVRAINEELAESEAFSTLLSKYFETHTAQDLAQKVEVIPSTLLRWANGHSMPLYGLKVMVTSYINKELAKPAEFKDLVSEYLKHHTAIELADEYECAVSTVNRWSVGVASPRDRVKSHVINYINKVRTEEKW